MLSDRTLVRALWVALAVAVLGLGIAMLNAPRPALAAAASEVAVPEPGTDCRSIADVKASMAVYFANKGTGAYVYEFSNGGTGVTSIAWAVIGSPLMLEAAFHGGCLMTTRIVPAPLALALPAPDPSSP